jgi:Ca2+-dependent lipid-binding protein
LVNTTRHQNRIERGLDYKPKSFGDLTITVVEARDLPQVSKFDKNDPYCIILLNGTDLKHQTKTALDAGQEARWNETVEWPDISENHTTLKLEVWEDDELKDVSAGRKGG